MKVPDGHERALETLRGNLNSLRSLVMEDVPARGLLPTKEGFAECQHKACAAAMCLTRRVKGKTTWQPFKSCKMLRIAWKGQDRRRKLRLHLKRQVDVVYASAVPVDAYLNQGGKVDYQAKAG